MGQTQHRAGQTQHSGTNITQSWTNTTQSGTNTTQSRTNTTQWDKHNTEQDEHNTKRDTTQHRAGQTLTLFSYELATWKTPCEYMGESQTWHPLPLLHLQRCWAAEVVRTGQGPSWFDLRKLMKQQTLVLKTIPQSSCKMTDSWHLAPGQQLRLHPGTKQVIKSWVQAWFTVHVTVHTRFGFFVYLYLCFLGSWCPQMLFDIFGTRCFLKSISSSSFFLSRCFTSTETKWLIRDGFLSKVSFGLL